MNRGQTGMHETAGMELIGKFGGGADGGRGRNFNRLAHRGHEQSRPQAAYRVRPRYSFSNP